MRRSLLDFLGVSEPTRGRAKKPPVYYLAMAVLGVVLAILCAVWGAPSWTTILFIVLAAVSVAVWIWVKTPKR